MKKLIMFLFLMLLFSYNTVYADLSDGLVAYYSFNGNANDESGNGNHGTLMPVGTGPISTEDRFEMSESAYSFDGNDDYIDIPFNPILEPTHFTLSAWFKTIKATGTILNNDRDNDDCLHGYKLRVNEKGRFSVDPSAVCLDSSAIYSNDKLNDGRWHHLVAILAPDSSPNQLLYVDGSLQNESNDSTWASTGMSVRIGMTRSSLGQHSYFQGVIDDIRIYNRALSSDEIQSLYSGGQFIPTVSEWGIIIFFILLVGSALWVIRRKIRQESV